MPRPLRPDFAGAVHHLYARGNRKQPLFVDDDDYRLYLALLGGIVVAKKWRVLAYCLMPNHVHLVVETPEPTLARGMQHLHGLYARLFNDRHDFVGHLFQGRYGSKLVRDDAQMLAVARYVALNPVDAQLCDDPAEWAWNSYRWAAVDERPPFLDLERLLAHLEVWGGNALARYQRIVSDALPARA